MREAHYQDWLAALFEHDPAAGDWRFEDELPTLDVGDHQVVRLVRRLLENIREDTAPYSDWQVAMGLSFVFNKAGSDYDVQLRDGFAPFPERVAAIRAMKYLYADCFEHRCAPVLSHLDSPGTPLNGVCYILWDASSLSYCEERQRRTELDDAVIDVMAFALTMKNVACIESGLHGLGHMVPEYPPAKRVIRDFLKRTKGLEPDLRHYADAAQTGYIQ